MIASVANLAASLNVPYSWLYNLIRHESNFNPLAKNPRSSARGLIQFTDSTSRELGFRDSASLIKKYPTVDSQILGPVRAYFSLPASRPPYPTKQSLYLAVFFPSFRGTSPVRPFPPYVPQANPGVYTPLDYISRVDRSAAPGGRAMTKMIIVLCGALAALYFIHKG